jgi:Family of unknown function (DUF6267)
MNFSESLRALADKILHINESEELTKAHVEHPEDLVLQSGSQGATRGLQAIIDTVQNPTTVTIKWDGYPALVFGRGVDGQFVVCDKHMFNKKDGSGRVTSPQAFAEYDRARGIVRGDLEHIIARIWPGLEKSFNGSGFYWGDLLFHQPLKNEGGLYKFKANPNGITYTVDSDSEMGNLIAGKVGGIAVHQFIPAAASNVQQSTLLNGSIGQLKNNSNVAIVPAKMPMVPKMKISKADISTVQKAISQYGAAADAWILNPPAGVKTTFPLMCTVYINKKIVSGNLNNMVGDFYEFFKTRPMSDSIRAKLTQHFQQNEAGIQGAFAIWIALYNLKMKVVEQLDKAAADSPVKGYLQDGTQSQEGFVSQGVKLVNRMGFSRQNLAGRA